jgi:transcriptional antiterminator RfaH
MNWYVVKTKPRGEKLAQTSLQNVEVETFLPQIMQARRAGKRLQTVIGPLFPGYIFARFDLNRSYRAVKYAHGVQTLVAFGGTLAQVEEPVIEFIRSKLHNGCVIPPSPSFTPGQSVKIQNGVFQGLEGVFEREMEDRERVVLLIHALSYQTRVIVSFQDVANF